MMPPQTQIKVCGLTRAADARYAVELGVNALGFIFYPKSPRYIAPHQARAIIDLLPPFVPTIAVMVNEPIAQAREILRESGCRMAQLHGTESPEYFDELAFPAIKALPVATRDDLTVLPAFARCASAFLLDTKMVGQVGGTGVAFDWTLASLARSCGRPVILAGGLTPENVREALMIAMPHAVDVNSGIECEPGVKDHQRMRQFVRNVRSRA